MALEEHVLSDEVQGNQARVAELIAFEAWNYPGADAVRSTSTTITSPSAATSPEPWCRCSSPAACGLQSRCARLLHRASAGTSVSPVVTGEAMSLLQPISWRLLKNLPLEVYGNLPYDAVKRIRPCLPPALPLVSKPESAPIFI